MKLESSEAWNLLLSSRLVAPQYLGELAERIKREEIRFDDPATFFDWLQQARVITPYQAKILAAKEAGPFVFGEYVVSQRIESGPLSGQFFGFHRPTGHPVLLEFFHPESPPIGRSSWTETENLGQKVSTIKSPHLIATYEPVSLPDYAFVVGEKPPGLTLSEKVPRKARLPWQAALGMLHQLATALNEMHLLGVVHGDLNARSIFLEGKMRPRLKVAFTRDSTFQDVDPATGESRHDYQAPEVLFGEPPTVASDIYSLGCLFVRLTSGRTITGCETVSEKIEALKNLTSPDLSKYDLPANLMSLIRSTLELVPSKRPASVKEVLQEITRHLSKDSLEQPEPEATSDSLNRYLKHRAVSNAFFASPVTIDPSTVNLDASSGAKNTTRSTAAIADVVEFQKRIHAERRKSQLVRGIILLAGTAAMFAIVFFSISRSKVSRPELATEKVEKTADGANSSDEKLEDLTTPAPPNAVVHQFVRDDDGLLLWESPSAGQRFSFELLPLNPRMIFIARLAELANHPQGSLALQSLGPEFQQALDGWRQLTGLELTDVRQVVVALYPLDDARYTPLSVVYLANDVPLVRLREIWNVTENAEPTGIYSNATTAFLAKTSPRAADKIESFVMGPKNLVEQAADYKAINSLDGSLGELANRVDASRHFTAMILPSALFNQQGQELVGKLWEPVNRQARILTDDHIRGVLFSAHFEADQSYWELTVDHTADVKNQALVDSLKKSFADAQSMIVDAAAFLPADNYWNRVRLRLDNMFDGFVRNSRFGAESGFVIVNSWVPATAVHNLLKASDLAVRMNGTSPIAAAAKPVAPQSLSQLLAIKRDLKVTTNPDLNVLLQNLVTEVKDSHPGLPFEFRIELIGNDLVGEGITQNQRPGDFELKDATLASILTEIVVRANPDKSATGPADPKCKLVWVIGDDPQKPGAKIIQITTRAAAEAKSLELPQAFRVEQP